VEQKSFSFKVGGKPEIGGVGNLSKRDPFATEEKEKPGGKRKHLKGPYTNRRFFLQTGKGKSIDDGTSRGKTGTNENDRKQRGVARAMVREHGGKIGLKKGRGRNLDQAHGVL